MINWDNFYIFGLFSILCGIVCSIFSLQKKEKKKLVIFFAWAEIIILTVFIIGLWSDLGRPPFKTMGETRLWFSLFISVAGLSTYRLWKYRAILPYTALLSSVFILINIFKPEIHDKTLMPALQSIWFIPHVAIYMFSYAFLGASFIIAIYQLIKPKENLFPMIDNMVYLGISTFTIGMLIGALWAKEAWGHYWNWDPKECWALATWLLYILYIHVRFQNQRKSLLTSLLVIAFLSLQICWYGVNYLPAARHSIHLYNQ